MNGHGAELAEFVRAELVVVMMSVPLNRVAAIAFLSLFFRAHSLRMGGHPAMGYIPTKPSPTEDTNSTVFQEVDHTTHQRRFELHHRVPGQGHDVGAARTNKRWKYTQREMGQIRHRVEFGQTPESWCSEILILRFRALGASAK